MTRNTGVQIGLLAFGVAIVAGLHTGNSAMVILTRALAAMVLGVVIGQIAGGTTKLVLRDYLQRKKLGIDREHRALMASVTDTEAEIEEADQPTPTPAG